MQIGSKVKKLRELRNFTQSYLADYLSITQSTYSRYEKDELHFSDEMLQKLSHVLGLSREAMLQFDEEKLFLYIENVCNCEQYQSAKEHQLTEALIDELRKDNAFLRASVTDLREMMVWMRKSNE
jgi:transcriptional regulator with XRE-family HTH domain